MPNANASKAPEAIEASDAGDARPVDARPRPVDARPRGLRAVLLGGGLAAFTFALVSASVPCGFARMFHMPCPGCGSTRAMLALASGDLAGVLRLNPLAPFMTLLMLALALQALASVIATGTLQRVGDGRVGMVVSRGVLVILALEVLIWVARFGGFLGGPVPV